MDRIAAVLRTLRGMLGKDAADRELDEEVRFHIEMERRANIRKGMGERAARRAALVAFGGVERFKEERREASWARVIEDFFGDVRFALRVTIRRPGLAVAIVATMGLSIGGTTAIFSVVDDLFLRAPAGVKDGAALRKIFIRRDAGWVRTPDGGSGSYVDYETLRDVPAFEAVSAYHAPSLHDMGRGVDAERIRVMYATHDFLPMLGLRPALGRFFTSEEDGAPGAHPVAVISHALWRTRFGGERDVLGRTVHLNGTAMTIIGVGPPGFSGVTGDAADMVLPMAVRASPNYDFRKATLYSGVDYIARLADGSTPELAVQQASAALAHAVGADSTLDATPEVILTGFARGATPTRTKSADLALWLGLVAVMVLVIACLNIANLLLARAVAARREFAVRRALGASRLRLVRQHLSESIMLALVGGVVGLAVMRWSIALIRQFPLPPDAGTIDGRILLFTLAIALLSGIGFGILPALRSGAQPMDTMRESHTTTSAGGTRIRRWLVTAQVTLSLVLVIGAGLFVRSVRAIYAIDPGVDLERVAVVTVRLGDTDMPPQERELFYQLAEARVRQLSSVERTAMVHFHPYSGNAMGPLWGLPGGDKPEFEEGPYLNLAGPEYFATVGTRILEGREFDATDRSGAAAVAVVTQSLARAVAPTGSAIGSCLRLGDQVKDGGCTRIVGVAEDVRWRYLRPEPVPQIFLARGQDPQRLSFGGPALVVRTRGQAKESTAAIRGVVQSLRPDLPYVSVRALDEVVRKDVLPYRLGAMLFSMFSGLALILSAIGLAGVLGYFVNERTQEIGVRRSLGAPAARVVDMVVRQALAPVLIGVVLGLVLALGGLRLLTSLLFDVSARDPVAIVGAILVMIATALLAAFGPARRATRIDPMQALRRE